MTALSTPYERVKALPERLAGLRSHLWAVAVATIGSMAIIWSTRWGPWVYSDSTEYIVSARNLLAGKGLGLFKASGAFQPLYLHPPGYPLLLAGVGLLGIDLVDAARWLNVMLFAGTVSLAGLLVYEVSGRRTLAIGASLFVLSLPTLVELYSGAMTEPVFYVAGLAGILLLLRYFERGRRRLLLGAALAFGLSTLTRYPGIALVGAAVLGIGFFGQGRLLRRAADAGLLTIISSAPVALWTIWIAAQPGGGSPRQWTVVGASLWQRLTPFRIELSELLWGWIPYNGYLPPLPYHPKPRLLMVGGLFLAALVGWAAIRFTKSARVSWRRLRSVQLGSLLLAFAVLTVLLLAATFALSTPALERSDVDRRMLSGVQLATAILIFPLADILIRAWPARRWIGWAAGLVTVLGIAWYLPQTWEMVSTLHDVGAGYTGVGWRGSPTVRLVKDLPSELPLVTNESAALQFLLDRPAYDIPELVRRQKLRSYARFGDGPDQEDRVFREEGAALVLFDSAWLHFYPIYEAQTDERLEALTQGLALYAQTSDGAVYFYAGGSE